MGTDFKRGRPVGDAPDGLGRGQGAMTMKRWMPVFSGRGSRRASWRVAARIWAAGLPGDSGGSDEGVAGDLFDYHFTGSFFC